MDPYLQSGIGLLFALALGFFGWFFIIPLLDRIADHFEKRGRRLPPAE